MRNVIAATALLAITLVAASPSSAQNRQSLNDSFNTCVELAKQRGWSTEDLGSNRDAVRKFVIQCMQGGQSKAKKR